MKLYEMILESFAILTNFDYKY